VRELHVVAVSEDGQHVLLAGRRGATKGGFRLALNDRLAAALKGDLPGPGQEAPQPSELTPKQIQSRLRAGESAEAIALAAGVPVARVERFSGPVQGEMARMIDATRSAYLVRGRRGRSALSLGEAVDLAIDGAPSLREDGSEWTTHREEEGQWLVKVTWYARKRSREASWRYDPTTRTVTAVDPASAAMAFVETAGAETVLRRRSATKAPVKRTAARKAPVTKAPAKKAATEKAPAKKAPATRAVAVKAPAKRAPVRKAVAVKAPAKKAPARKAVAIKAPAKKAPASKAPARKAVAVKAPAKRAAVTRAAVTKAAVAKAPAKKAPARKAPARIASPPAAVRRPGRAPRALSVVPDPQPTKPTRRPTAAERDGVKTRATVPGWADVLLGTSPGSDR
jgi:hypothetical protein